MTNVDLHKHGEMRTRENVPRRRVTLTRKTMFISFGADAEQVTERYCGFCFKWAPCNNPFERQMFTRRHGRGECSPEKTFAPRKNT